MPDRGEETPLFLAWCSTLDWILDRCEGMPKNVRFTLNGRISNLALDTLEAIIEAIHTKERAHLLRKANLHIEKLRVLFRVCYNRKYISESQYEHVSRELDTSGRMTGGWLKSIGR